MQIALWSGCSATWKFLEIESFFSKVIFYHSISEPQLMIISVQVAEMGYQPISNLTPGLGVGVQHCKPIPYALKIPLSCLIGAGLIWAWKWIWGGEGTGQKSRYQGVLDPLWGCHDPLPGWEYSLCSLTQLRRGGSRYSCCIDAYLWCHTSLTFWRACLFHQPNNFCCFSCDVPENCWFFDLVCSILVFSWRGSLKMVL